MGQAAICLLALLGHFALWLGLFNRLHSLALPRWQREVAEKLILTGLMAILALAVAAIALVPESLIRPLEFLHARPAAAAYFWLCCAIALPIIGLWLRRATRRPPAQLAANHSQVLRIARELGRLPCDRTTAFWARVPGNQVLQLEINEKTLLLPRLPPELDGLRIAHLSDLHFTGKFTREFFDLVVQRTNQMHPNLVAVTGDIIDRSACLPWMSESLGQLRSELGAFCILGNHERRLPDKAAIVNALEAAGLRYLGGGCCLVERNGAAILLAGNELPWWTPAADVTQCPTPQDAAPSLRLLLAHSPDQIGWARRFDFDLMLAGHTHGGQIRPPLIGPIVCQSHYGVKYASGVFYEPPTLLHVSRGVSGCQPLRINCRPELAVLVLRREPAAHVAQSS